MGVVQARIQTVEDIYRLVWAAVAKQAADRNPLSGTSSAVFAHTDWDGIALGNCGCCATNTAGRARADCSRQVRRATGAALCWRNSVRGNCWRMRGAQRQTTPVRYPVLSTPILMPRIRQSAIHKRDSEAIG